jgi:two-component system cell cycle response regulator
MLCDEINRNQLLRGTMPSKTIMVVDDSSTIRKIIQRELSKADYEVMLAKSGMEAIAMLEWADTLPDMITLDIDMPKMNGFEVCEKIRDAIEGGDEHKQRIAKVPIVFVSANDTIENRQRGYELGVIDFISKPFTSGKILNTINNILNAQEQFPDMTALIVEDSPFIRRIVRNILARHGLKIHEVASGEEALEVVKSENFKIDIVITDYIMPGMSGEDLCRTLRSLEPLEQVPIFFISSVESKESILGFFKVGANDYLPKPFTEEEFRSRILTHLRNRKYVKELEYLNAKLKYLAEHDALTDLYNRGYFQKELESYFAQSKYRNENLCCILLDLDYFKKVNDHFGHAFGDLVLTQFAEILKKNRRSTDIAARFGGEEFVLLLPETTLADGVEIAEQIQKDAEGFIYSDGNTEMQVTISLGISSLPDHRPETPDKLLLFADQALYTAKAQGRNRVTVYEEV